jgi:hypothetical protein
MGAKLTVERMFGVLSGRPRAQKWLPPLGLAAMIAGPFVMTVYSHPWGLTSYTALVGSAQGAARLGLNRTFWGYTTGAVTEQLNESMPGAGQLYLHDTAHDSFDMLKRDGRLRSDILGTLNISHSTHGLYHHEPHMGRVEYQMWVDYGTTTPAHIETFQGVPVVWIYERPLRQ